MWSFFIKNNRFSFLLIIALIGLGSFSVLSIPKESAPEVQVPVGIVSTVLPGAPAADVENLVTNEIERGLAGTLSNIKKITSSSREGVSVITVEFEASADIDDSIQELKDEVDTIVPELPEDAEDPFVQEVDFVDQPILTIAVAGDRTPEEFTAIADEFESEIESIAGVSKVESSGVQVREVTVVVDQASLNQFDLSISEVVSAISAANATFPIGQIVNNDITYNVAFEGDIEDPAEVSGIPVAVRGGQPVFVRDIATIDDGLAPATSISRLSVGGEPSRESVSFNVFKQSGGDITKITAAVLDRTEELQAPGQFLADLTVYPVLDSGEEIRTDLIDLSTSGLQTVVLVILALIVAIGWREGLIAGSAIPLSFLIGFIGLYLSGNTINFLSLFALILGIGVLVDSGIVMIEGINRKMKDKPDSSKVEAALEAVSEFSAPLTSGTLTTVSMFVGLFIVSGVTGQFIAAIPFTLVFVLFASLLVALGFLPLIASLVLKRRSATTFEQKQVQYANELESWYRLKLRAVIENRVSRARFISLIMAGFIAALLLLFDYKASVVAGILVFVVSNWIILRPLRKTWIKLIVWFGAFITTTVISIVLTGFLGERENIVRVVFFEQSDVEWIIAEIELPEGTIKETTDIATRRVEDLLYGQADIEAFATTIGAGSAFGSGGSNEKLANVFVILDPARTRTSTEIIDELRPSFEAVRDFKVTLEQPSNGPPTGSPIGVKLTGDDLDVLAAYANTLAERLKNIKTVTNVKTSTNNNNTEFVFTLDQAKTAAAGLDPRSVSLALRTAVFGTEATTLTTLDEDIEVIVKLNLTNDNAINAANTNYTTVETLENISLPTPDGNSILLASLVSTSLRESSNVISHEDQKRIVSLSADLTAGGNVIEVNNEILRIVEAELPAPDGVTLSLGGETEESDQSFREMGYALIVGIVLMVGVLVLQFNSYRYTLYVLSILPFSLIGILLGLAITNNPLSFPSIMGFIALTGIVVNNSILLIDRINQMRLDNPEEPVRELVLKASSSRLRPILLTTLTTVLGMIPLLTVDPIWVPLAFAIMFGLAFSVVITLILVPIIYDRWPGTIKRKGI